jgi:predicted HTH transcriptional regulator
MNTTSNLLQRISNGEDSYTQLKANITSSDKLAQEIVAFSNARGGLLIVGVEDDGTIQGLDDHDIRRVNQLIGNVINANITPPVYPLVEIVNIEDKKIIVIDIDEGANKPYATNGGIYLTKAGSDKRKISPQELRRLFAESKNLYPDEEIVHGSSIENIDVGKLKKFLEIDNREILDQLNNGKRNLETVLTNLELYRKRHLSVAGNLLFGQDPQRFAPSFYVDCCYFDGNDVSVTRFISKKTIKGTFDELYEDSMRFVVSQLRTIQIEEDFNSNGELEIKKEVLTELIVNALVHRDYYINASIKIFMFHDRIEIISPGKLTNSLTVEKIKNGIAVQRNPILSSICKTLLPYTGYGSGIKRVMQLNPDVEWINDTEMEQFRCIIHRKGVVKLGDKLGDRLGDKYVNLTKNRQMILESIAANRTISITELSQAIGISTTAVENNIKYLKEHRLLKRRGGAKGGSWEISDEV